MSTKWDKESYHPYNKQDFSSSACRDSREQSRHMTAKGGLSVTVITMQTPLINNWPEGKLDKSHTSAQPIQTRKGLSTQDLVTAARKLPSPGGHAPFTRIRTAPRQIHSGEALGQAPELRRATERSHRRAWSRCPGSRPTPASPARRGQAPLLLNHSGTARRSGGGAPARRKSGEPEEGPRPGASRREEGNRSPPA